MSKKSTPAAALPIILGSFTLQSASLRNALARLKPAMTTKPIQPILTAVLIARSNDETILAAQGHTIRAVHRIASALPLGTSDLARALSASRHARENCLLAISYKDLAEALSACGKEAVRITSLAEGEIHSVEISYAINGDTVRKTARAFDPALFPPAQPENYGTPFTFDANARSSFFKAYEAVSTDETRYILNGVALDASTDHHAAAATDGRQLIRANSITLPFSDIVVVPASPIFDGKLLRDHDWTLALRRPSPRKHGHEHIRKALARLDKQLAPFYRDGEEDENEPATEDRSDRFRDLEKRKSRVEAYRDEKDAIRLRIECGGTAYDFYAIDGDFPNYKQCIPSEADYEISVPFTAAVREKILAVVPKLPADNRDKMRSIDICIDREHVSLAAGKTVVHLPATPAWIAKPAARRMSIQRDFLVRAARLGFTTLNLTGPESALVFTGTSSCYVAMPMRIDA